MPTTEQSAAIGSMFAIAVVASAIWYFVYFRRRKQNHINDAKRSFDIESNSRGNFVSSEVKNPIFGANNIEDAQNSPTVNDDDDYIESIESVRIEGILKSGYLLKKSTGMTKGWLRRYFFVKDGKLFYVHRDTDLIEDRNIRARHVANLLISTVKEVSDVQFQIVSPGQRSASGAGGVYELQADNAQDARDWLVFIRRQIEGALHGSLRSSDDNDNANGGYATEDGQEGVSTVPGSVRIVPSTRVLTELKSQNTFCADCGAASPDWASLNLCILICIDCSGIHRKLGTHISKVRSLTLDMWTYNSIQLILTVGNLRSNGIWEAQLESMMAAGGDYTICKPCAASSMEEREEFIRSKYVDGAFAVARDATPEQKTSYLLRCAEVGDLHGIIRAIAAGAEVSRLGPRPASSSAVASAGSGQSLMRSGNGSGGGSGGGGSGRLGSNNNSSHHSNDAEEAEYFETTALHMAVAGNHVLGVELLCHFGAPLHAVDDDGKRPIDIAHELGFIEIENILSTAAHGQGSD